MTYKYGSWYYKPANESEAREIVERAKASGAKSRSEWAFTARFYGVYKGEVKPYSMGTKYTIDEVREKFPLPGEQVNTKWNGEGLPPAGVVCEFKLNDREWYETYIVGRSRTGGIVFECSKFSPGFLYGECLSEEEDRFRPLCTEREIFVDHVLGLVTPGAQTDAELAEAIYHALKSGTLKAPKVEL